MIHTLHTILLLVYILVCCVLTVIVLMQEGKQADLPERSAAPLRHTGVRTRVVPWKVD